jgi:di/tricarboxylate transporter
MLAITLVLVFLTEIMSNTAAVAAFEPVVASPSPRWPGRASSST